jgi:hypothetical protein
MKATRRRDDETTFLNVDLDIWAAYDLAPLVEAFGPHVSDMFTGAVEAEEGAYQTHLELEVAERDPIGIQGGVTPRTVQYSLRADTLAAASRLNANIALTVYAVDVAYLQRRQRQRAKA